jgi:YhcH/YjgK/YiaL family protein
MKRAYTRTITVVIISLMSLCFTGCSRSKEVVLKKISDQIIHDQIKNANLYYEMHPSFKEAFAFLQKSDLATLPAGRYDIKGDDLFCIIQRADGRSRAEAKLEAHQIYIDIQYLIGGSEEMGWSPLTACTQVDQVYDAERDIGFFKDEPQSWTQMKPGDFTVFFPADAHAPMVSTGEIHKAVVKVRIQ